MLLLVELLRVHSSAMSRKIGPAVGHAVGHAVARIFWSLELASAFFMNFLIIVCRARWAILFWSKSFQGQHGR